MMERWLQRKIQWTELPAVLAEGLLRLHGSGVELAESVWFEASPTELMDATPERLLVLGTLPLPKSKSLAPVATSSNHSARTSPATWGRSRQAPPVPMPLAASWLSAFRDPPAAPYQPNCNGYFPLLRSDPPFRF